MPLSAEDKEIFHKLTRHETLRKLRSSFDFLLGHPIWWIFFKQNGDFNCVKSALESSYDIWFDPRVRDFRFSKAVCAGIKKQYQPSELVGRCVAMVVNLEFRNVMGVESQGMALAADDNGPVLLKPDRDVPPGSIIK